MKTSVLKRISLSVLGSQVKLTMQTESRNARLSTAEQVIRTSCALVLPLLLWINSANADTLISHNAWSVGGLNTTTGAAIRLGTTVDNFGSLKDIVEVSTCSEKILILARSGRESDGRLGVYAVKVPSGQTSEILSPPDMRSAEISQNCRKIAIAQCDHGTCTISVAQTDDASTVEKKYRTQQVSSVVWSPDNKKIAIALTNDEIAIIEAESGKEIAHVAGFGVAWSPDGTKLAVLREEGKEVGILTWPSLEYQQVLRRWFWQTRVVGNLHWSPNGLMLAINAPSGFLGYDITCSTVDVKSSRLDTIATTTSFCGPWLVEDEHHS